MSSVNVKVHGVTAPFQCGLNQPYVVVGGVAVCVQEERGGCTNRASVAGGFSPHHGYCTPLMGNT